MELSLLFEDNGTGHKDLILRFAGASYACDTYYLALDYECLTRNYECLTEREGVDAILLVLKNLLEQWHFAVQNLSNGGTVYLPYDFSDQYTGWLRCLRSGDTVTVCQGWAGVEGFSFSPSAVGEYLTLLPSFQPIRHAVQVSFEELVQTIYNMVTSNR